jgi:hypothetical protein
MKGAFFFLAAFTFLLTFSSSGPAQGQVRLFSIRDVPAAVTDKTSIASVREADIEFPRGITAFREMNEAELPLFDGKLYRAARIGTEIRSMDDHSWWGKIREGKFDGDVILTFRKGFVAGLIYSPGAVYEIVPRGDRHILVELDQSLFPECGGEIASDAKETAALPLAGPSVDSGDRIDVLVVYTTATKNFLGGDAQAQTLSQQAVDATNGAYLNSRIRQRVRMVHSEEYLYTETASASTDLSNLRSNTTIQANRNTHNADLVAMIGEIAGACGVGYLMGANVNGNPNNGFTVTARSCAVGNLTFAHELGHNMGSQHNPENGSGATYFYGYGHYQNQIFRTVMSYVDPCPNGCTRRAYFSNPTILYNGFPTGIDNQRDNARAINNTADAIANYRYSGSSITLTDPVGVTALPRGIRRTLNWSSNNLGGNVRIELSRDEGTIWETIVASTPNDGAEAITVWGPATRRARVRVVSIDNPIVSDSSVRNFPIR